MNGIDGIEYDKSASLPGGVRWWRGVVGIAIIVVAAIIVWAWFSAPDWLPAPVAALRRAQIETRGAGARNQGERPVLVLAATAKKAEVPVWFDGVGSSRAVNTVTVRAQVDGRLTRVNFREGQDVEAGFVLAEIEATLYQAQYDQAVAKKAVDAAQLANARIDLERYAKLTVTNSASRQQYDTQRAQVLQLEAQVQADQGAVDNSKAILSYTKIEAPIAGRTGLRLVDAGNVVHAADTTGIVTITQVKPIAVVFVLPQQRLAEVNRAFARGPLGIEALGNDNRTVIDHGVLTVIDNQVDQATGTVKLKGEFPNADLQIWPGQFVNVKLRVDTLRDVIVVPTAAVQRGPDGPFTYVATADGTAVVRPVTVAVQDDVQAVVTTGIDEGERVITTAFNQLSNGAKVKIGVEDDPRPVGRERRRGGPPSVSARQASRREFAPAFHEEVAPEKGIPPVEAVQRPGKQPGGRSLSGTTRATP